MSISSQGPKPGKSGTYASSSRNPRRSVKKRKDGSRVISKTKADGSTVRKVKKADGSVRKSIKKTNRHGAVVKKSTTRNMDGKVTGMSKSVRKNGATTKTSSRKNSAAVKAKNLLEAGKTKGAKKVHNLTQRAKAARIDGDSAKAKQLRQRAKAKKFKMIERIKNNRKK